MNFTSFAQSNHYLVLEKKKGQEQKIYSGAKFPEKEIKEQLEKSFRIKKVNFREDSWFVLLEKDDNAPQQQFLYNPNVQLLKEKIDDRYEITDMTFYLTDDKKSHNTLYVLTKLPKNSTLKTYFYTSFIENNSKILADTIQDGYDKGYLIKFVKANILANIWCFSLVMVNNSEQHTQFSRYRQDPLDFINNKAEEGFIPTSLSYFNFNSSWHVVVTKYPNTVENWLFNYKTDKSKIEDYINNKGFIITNVF
jgi:hypothetical protein